MEQSIHGLISLESLGGGVALERFREELALVLKNITDHNTDAKAKREIKLVVAFKPTAQRDTAQVEISCQAKLAPVCSYATRAYIGVRGQEVLAFEHNPQQLTVDDFIEANQENVTNMPAAEPAKESNGQ